MKKLFLSLAAVLALAGVAEAQTAVRGYTKKDGTYVAPHYRSSPNATTSDNYSTRGNVNPYTGTVGTKPDTNPAYGASSPNTSPSPWTSTTTTSKAKCTTLYGC